MSSNSASVISLPSSASSLGFRCAASIAGCCFTVRQSGLHFLHNFHPHLVAIEVQKLSHLVIIPLTILSQTHLLYLFSNRTLGFSLYVRSTCPASIITLKSAGIICAGHSSEQGPVAAATSTQCGSAPQCYSSSESVPLPVSYTYSLPCVDMSDSL